MDWKKILSDAGLPVVEAGEVDGRVEAAFIRPLSAAEVSLYLALTDPRAARLAAAEGAAALAVELKSVTGEQAAAWIEANVTSLASAKTALKVLARFVVALRDGVFPGLPER